MPQTFSGAFHAMDRYPRPPDVTGHAQRCQRACGTAQEEAKTTGLRDCWKETPKSLTRTARPTVNAGLQTASSRMTSCWYILWRKPRSHWRAGSPSHSTGNVGVISRQAPSGEVNSRGGTRVPQVIEIGPALPEIEVPLALGNLPASCGQRSQLVRVVL